MMAIAAEFAEPASLPNTPAVAERQPAATASHAPEPLIVDQVANNLASSQHQAQMLLRAVYVLL